MTFPSVEHDTGCYWLRCYPPVDGDEAANCTCGAVGDGYMEWLSKQQPQAPAMTVQTFPVHDWPWTICGYCEGRQYRCGCIGRGGCWGGPACEADPCEHCEDGIAPWEDDDPTEALLAPGQFTHGLDTAPLWVAYPHATFGLDEPVLEDVPF